MKRIQTSKRLFCTLNEYKYSSVSFKLKAKVREDMNLANKQVSKVYDIGVEEYLGIKLTDTSKVTLGFPGAIPVRTQLFTVLKAPFRDKTAMEQFHLKHYGATYRFELFSTKEDLPNRELDTEKVLVAAIAKFSLLSGIETAWTIKEFNFTPKKEELLEYLKEI